MKSIASKQTLIGISLFLLPLLLYIGLKYFGYFDSFVLWSQNNVVLFVTVLVLIKILGIVYPPIPGGLLTLGAIPIIGWKAALAIDFVGNTIGATIAYCLGLKYGFVFLEKIFDNNIIQKIRKIKIKKDKELESMFVIRMLGGNVVEIISYGAGLLKFSFPKFIFATVVSHLMIGIPVYYFAKNIFTATNIISSLVVSVIIFTIVWKIKGRYFE